jgi:hypothetical protein
MEEGFLAIQEPGGKRAAFTGSKGNEKNKETVRTGAPVCRLR